MLAILTAVLAGVACVGELGLTEPAEPGTNAVVLDVQPSEVDLTVGDTAHLEAMLENDDGEAVTGYSVNWSTSDASVITVTAEGVVTAVAEGTVTVIAEATSPEDGESLEDSAKVGTSTPSSGPVGSGSAADFSDGFETGDVSTASSGFEWGYQSANTSVVAENPHSGSYSLRIEHLAEADGEDSFEFIDFSMPELEEVWVEYYIYIPDNYYHRSQSSSDNNKFFQLWSGQRNDANEFVFPETVRADDQGNSRVVFKSMEDGSAPTIISNFPGTSDRGTWNQVRFHIKLPVPVGSANGVVEVWLNGNLEYSRSDIPRFGTVPPPSEEKNFFDAGRLLGWSNSGFDNNTSFYFDDVKMWTVDPAW